MMGSRRKFLSCLLAAYGLTALCFGFTAGCGSALPQVSIPPPSEGCDEGDGCVVGSSPDAGGFVVVEGDAGAVPGGALVQAEVGESSAFFNPLDLLCSKAYAAVGRDLLPAGGAECSSDLPLCEEGGSTEDCYVVADDDGSFVLRIAAEIGDTIQITYLDPDTCEESPAFDITVTGDLNPLDIEGVALTSDNRATAYVFGEDSDGMIGIIAFNVDDASTGTYSTALIGTPLSIGAIPNNDKRVAAVTDEQTAILDLSPDAPTVTILTDSAGASLTAGQVVVQRSFDYPASFSPSSGEDFTCVDSILEGRSDIDRIFFVLDDEKLASDPDTPLALIDNGNEAMSGTTMAVEKTIGYDFGTLDSDLIGARLTNVKDFFISQKGDEGFFLGRFLLGSGEERFYLVEVPVKDGLCNRIDSSNYPNLRAIEMHSSMTDPGKSFWFGTFGFEAGAQTEGMIVIPDTAAETGGFAVDVIEGITGGFGELEALDPTRVSGVTRIMPVAFPSSRIKLGGIGDSIHLVRVDMEGDGESFVNTEIESDIIVGVRPVDMAMLLTTDLSSVTEAPTLSGKLLILSRGLEGDGAGFLRTIDLEDL
ncbi:MAG: hypothetical protein HYU99_05020 [Deltaproteobacteria bacterium]|nr:hypothetical protein [Deltaproteobacteria bacterium]